MALNYWEGTQAQRSVVAQLVREEETHCCEADNTADAVQFGDKEIALQLDNREDIGAAIRSVVDELMDQGRNGDPAAYKAASSLITEAAKMKSLDPNLLDQLDEYRKSIRQLNRTCRAITYLPKGRTRLSSKGWRLSTAEGWSKTRLARSLANQIRHTGRQRISNLAKRLLGRLLKGGFTGPAAAAGPAWFAAVLGAAPGLDPSGAFTWNPRSTTCQGSRSISGAWNSSSGSPQGN